MRGPNKKALQIPTIHTTARLYVTEPGTGGQRSATGRCTPTRGQVNRGPSMISSYRWCG